MATALNYTSRFPCKSGLRQARHDSHYMVLRPAQAYSNPRSTPQPRTFEGSSFKKEVARLGLVSLLRAIAIQKLYQAQTVRVITQQALAVQAAQQATGGKPDDKTTFSTENTSPSTLNGAADNETTKHQADLYVDASGSFAELGTVTASQSSSTYQAENGQKAANSISQPPPQQLCLVECALWTDELRHWQARRKALSDEIELQVARVIKRGGELAKDALLPFNAGPEFCPLTCCVEESNDFMLLCSSLRDRIHQLSTQLTGPPTGHSQAGASEGHVVASFSCQDVQAEIRNLQRKWQTVLQEVVYQQVRLAQLKQLPAQPKRRTTITSVQQQVTKELQDRYTLLQQYNPM